MKKSVKNILYLNKEAYEKHLERKAKYEGMFLGWIIYTAVSLAYIIYSLWF